MDTKAKFSVHCQPQEVAARAGRHSQQLLPETPTKPPQLLCWDTSSDTGPSVVLQTLPASITPRQSWLETPKPLEGSLALGVAAVANSDSESSFPHRFVVFPEEPANNSNLSEISDLLPLKESPSKVVVKVALI